MLGLATTAVPGGRRRVRAGRSSLLASVFIATLAVFPAIAGADELPPGFVEQTVLEGLTQPTAVQFAPDGRIFVAEKEGKIKVFDRLRDPSPETFVDMRREVNGFLDRGMLGLALSPNFATDGAVYIAYTHDAPVGGTAPTYGADLDPDTPDDDWLDYCVDACEVSGRVSRLTPDGAGPPQEDVLLEDWCQQWGSHSIGALEFDPQGRLYVSGGDGANFNQEDYGQTYVLTDPTQPHHPTNNPYLSPPNACGDPGSAEGEAPPGPGAAEGGALRSQDLRTSADPLSLSGTIARIDPQNGNGVSGNPLFSSNPASSNAARIVASGLRNPFRFAIAPDGDVWLGDVGWRTWEEINSFDPDGPAVTNFGWPCYEGVGRTEGYKDLGIGICTSLYAAPSSVAAPEFTYDHRAFLYPGDPCPVPGGGSSTSGVEFYAGASFPAEYDGALFFTDYARSCIWVMRTGAGGVPDPSTVQAFDQHLIAPVDLEVGPGDALYYVDIGLGEVRRIQHFDGNQPPVAQASVDEPKPAVGEQVSFDGEGSTDPDLPVDVISFAWDLDGDAAFDDSTESQPSYTYGDPGPVEVGLRVTDANGLTDETTLEIAVGNAPDDLAITNLNSDGLWETGQVLPLRGTATDVEDASGALTLSWEVDLNHCLPGGNPGTGCHVHTLPPAFGGAYDLTGPEHEYPAKLTVRLTATDSDGLSTTVEEEFLPRTVDLQVQSQPAGASLGINGSSAAAPFTRTLIKNTPTSVSAASPQTLNAFAYDWCGWSDAGAQTHSFPATSSRTLTASFCGGRPPTDLALSSPAIDESRPPGTVVGTLSAADQDPADRYTYSLVAGDGDRDNGSFEIIGSTVRATASFNREDQSSLSIRVRADDGYRHGFSKPLAISVNDVDDPPTALALAGTTVAENQMIGTDVGTLSASDEDGDALSFALVRGPGDDHNSQFQISGSTLETAETLDHRDGPTRSIRVRVDDGRGGSEERALPIEVVAMDPELERLDLRVPGRAEKLIDDGVRAQLRCAVECRVAIELVGRGRIARRAGLEGSIGDGDGKLVGGRKQWLTARLDKRSERRLEAFGGKRSPRIVARFEAKRAD